MRIGIDFDNTIAGYDSLFERIGKDAGWLNANFRGSKKEVRDHVRRLESGETKWMRLQAIAYGARMAEAELIDGVASFLTTCRTRGAEVVIVSHKTVHAAADPGGVNLREAALAWMEAKGFFAATGFAIPRERVFFARTREEKCARIAELGCQVFIDDLEEIFAEPGFPTWIRRLLFHPGGGLEPHGDFTVFSHWDEISHAVFGAF
ncbi:MAG: hypothetical protein Q7R40_10775 [Phaeospirillum sp.]|nr:hypothetical protein [Phaeospirillum sp.]